MYHVIILIVGLFLLLSCEGHITGEVGGKYETNSSSSYTVDINGKRVKEVHSKKHSVGAMEFEFNVLIGDGDTIITNDEMPTLNSKIVCSQVLDDDDFEKLKTVIVRSFLDKNRLLTAKVAINDWCLNSNQVRDALELFTMDKYRLDFAKFTYGHVTDKVNYYRVKDAFSFEETKDKLDKYINTL